MATRSAAFDEVARTVQALDREFERCVATGEIARIVNAFYAPDAQVMPAHQPPIRGHEAILAFWNAVKAAGMKAVKLDTQRIEAAGDLACGIGQYTLTLEPQPGQTVTDTGKFVVVYRRQPDGAWKAIADMFSTNA